MSSKDCEDSFEFDIKTSSKLSRWFAWIPARLVLYLLALNGIMVTFIMRIIINFTILAMVKETPVNITFKVSESLCYINESSADIAPIDYGGTLDWSLDDQFYVLASFYWTYLISHMLGGHFVQKIGTKKLFGWSMLISSICVVCIPFTSYINYVIVVTIQLIHGFAQGLLWPSLYAVIGVWIPIHERSRFVTCFQGLSLGSMLSNLMSGFIITKLEWVYVFYCSGGLGFLSTLLWYLLMYDKPQQHPRISKEELQYIQENREKRLHSHKIIPWMSILSSIPVWSIGITSFGRMWLASIVTVYGPFYLKTIVGLTVEMNGLLQGTNAFAAFLSAFFFSFVSDKIVMHKLIPLVHNRKLFTAIGQIIPGVLALTLGYVNCNIPLIITIWFLINVFLTASFSGSMSNIVDISPSYSGPVSSFVHVILLLPTILTTLVVKILLQTKDTLQAWKIIYFTSSGVIIGTFIIYAIFASGTVQAWDLEKSTLNDFKAKKDLLKDDEVKSDNFVQ